MKKLKNTCSYCYGFGIDKFWHDTGMVNGYGKRMPVRWVLSKESASAYRCKYCDKPKHLEDAPEKE